MAPATGPKNYANKNAHMTGFGTLCTFPGASRKIATCGGVDQMVKIHSMEQKEGVEEAESEQIDHFGHGVWAVAVSCDGSMLAAGGSRENEGVALFNKNDDDEFQFERNVGRSSLDTRHLAFSPTSTLLAIASDEQDILVTESDPAKGTTVLEGHRGGVKYLAWDTEGKYLASSGSDATVRIWDPKAKKEVKCIEKAFSKTAASATFASGSEEGDGMPKNRCGLSWSPVGNQLAFASGDRVRVFERETWVEKEAFSLGDPNADCSLVQFSPNGSYLLTLDTNGLAIVWDVMEKESLSRHENPKGNEFQVAVFDPDFNGLIVMSKDGGYGSVGDVVADDKVGPHEMLDLDDDLEAEEIKSFDGMDDGEE
eukprot:CAMPEP_0114178870 /NCGR_PEP_ID=MMETSP0043_2-20121206/38773_1 /TAXON_ID=464988 /ORGANISM="Hemiselmis andersenii, Strain CCMP644" /LENGTH=367 /DNA_ID=CAMNT_0001277309 /DNA_START=17 /DNA_END=1117 /DNA_ORIENTATION=+